MNGQAARQRDGLGLGHADDDAADEAGPARRRHRVEIAEADARLGERPRDQPVEMIEMRARRDLRHDAAIGPMLGQLRQHQIGADARRAVAHHRGRGLVAARLDAQHQHGAATSRSPPRPARADIRRGKPVPTASARRAQASKARTGRCAHTRGAGHFRPRPICLEFFDRDAVCHAAHALDGVNHIAKTWKLRFGGHSEHSLRAFFDPAAQDWVKAVARHDVGGPAQNSRRCFLDLHERIEPKRSLVVVEEEIDVGLVAGLAACRGAEQVKVSDAELPQLRLDAVSAYRLPRCVP